MTESVGVRQLRNDVSAVLRRVEAGEHITVSVSGRPVAELRPVTVKRWTDRSRVMEILSRAQADPELTADLRGLVDEPLPDLTP